MPIVTSRNKSLGILSRRPDLSREDFQRYYETSHAPLAMCHYPFAKYVRNHVLGDVDPGFDTISEFWFDRQAAAKGFDPVKADAIMDQDEMKFMDRSNKRAGSVTEYLLSGPERTVESGLGAQTGHPVDTLAGDDRRGNASIENGKLKSEIGGLNSKLITANNSIDSLESNAG